MKLKTLLLATILAGTALGAQAAGLKIALQSDPDVLDPDQSRTFVGRIVYAALCDKLVDITPNLELIPQLATSWTWSDDGLQLTMKLRENVVFHDGTAFNAKAVADNINRSQTLEESRRKSELSSVKSIDILGDYEIRFNLVKPDVTLLAQLADRAGMMISPKAAAEAGADFGANPVCSGPFSFKERVSQDRIVLDKFPQYWNADAIKIDSVTYLPIPDATVRLANLQSGDVQIIDRLSATDLAQAESDLAINVEKAVSLGYQGVTFNIANGEGASTPWSKSKLLRQAFSYAIDRNALNQVVFNGAFMPGNQAFPPNSPWYDKSHPVPARDIAKAKALLAEAGYPDGLELSFSVPNSTVPMQASQVMQAMASEAGIKLSIQPKEFATLLSDDTTGDYVATQIGWSGRIDPDGNILGFVTTDAGLNDGHYSNPKVDELLLKARTKSDVAERKALYDEANAILDDELPIVYLYHQTWLWGLSDKLEGFVPYPDGMIRLENVTLK